MPATIVGSSTAPMRERFAALRHGVSTRTRGQRTALGIILHDAR